MKLLAINPASFEQYSKTFDWRKESFWSNNHPLQARADVLFEQLIPDSGDCETIEGEILRAAARLNYDGFNNGFGNNLSGAVKFLNEYFFHPDMASIASWLTDVANCSYSNSGRGLSAATFLLQEVVKSLPEGTEFHPNVDKLDCFNLNDPEPEYEEEEDDWDDGDDYEE